MTHVRVMLEYFHPWTNAAGFYVASANGWYRDAGLDVQVTLFDPLRGDTLDHLARGETEFGVFPTNRLLVHREQGEELVAVAAVNQRGMETIQALAGQGIERPRDLAGRRVALRPTPRGLAMVRHLVSADGGDPDAVDVVDSGFREISVDDIAAGRVAVDATFGGYWAWDALFTHLPAERRIMWPVDEIGAPAYHSYLLGTQADRVRDDSELIRAFLAATARGFAAAAAEPDVTLRVLNQVVPYFPAGLLARSLALIGPTWFHGGQWGTIRSELMSGYAAWLGQCGILAQPESWPSAVAAAARGYGSTATSCATPGFPSSSTDNIAAYVR